MFTITVYWHTFFNKTIIFCLRWSTAWNTETNTPIWSSSNRFNYQVLENCNVKIFNYIFAVRCILLYVSNDKTLKFKSQNRINTNAVLAGDAFDYNAQELCAFHGGHMAHWNTTIAAACLLGSRASRDQSSWWGALRL